MMLQIINEVAKVAAEKAVERSKHEEKSLSTLLSEELTKEAQKKSRKLTDQSKASDLNKNIFETIIAPGEGIDNNQVFNVSTGETVREL